MSETPSAIEALLQQVERLQAEHDEDHAVLEELQSALIAGAQMRPAQPAYPDWTAWVDQWLTQRLSRNPNRMRWCRRYAEHPEVADRLEALWHAWELAWPDPSARTSWYRDALDHQLAVIGSDDGPLRDCSAFEREHMAHKPLIPPFGTERP